MRIRVAAPEVCDDDGLIWPTAENKCAKIAVRAATESTVQDARHENHRVFFASGKRENDQFNILKFCHT